MPSQTVDERPIPDDRPFYRLPYDREATQPALGTDVRLQKKCAWCDGALVTVAAGTACTRCGRSNIRQEDWEPARRRRSRRGR